MRNTRIQLHDNYRNIPHQNFLLYCLQVSINHEISLKWHITSTAHLQHIKYLWTSLGSILRETTFYFNNYYILPGTLSVHGIYAKRYGRNSVYCTFQRYKMIRTTKWIARNSASVGFCLLTNMAVICESSHVDKSCGFRFIHIFMRLLRSFQKTVKFTTWRYSIFRLTSRPT